MSEDMFCVKHEGTAYSCIFCMMRQLEIHFAWSKVQLKHNRDRLVIKHVHVDFTQILRATTAV